MKIEIQTFTVHKRFALTISRGTTAQTTNIWVKIEHDGIEGWGEASPFSTGIEPQTTETLVKALEKISQISDTFNPLNRQQIERVLTELKTPSAARAAIDTALHDWMGKKAQLPLWKMWGLNLASIPPTSVTIGINTPEKVKERVRDWLNLTQAKILKVKLGSPEGIEADKEIILAVKKEAPPTTQITIDANGGWDLANAIEMCEWLAEQEIKYVEQPLPRGQEKDLINLKKHSTLPIFVDESCFTSRDIPLLAECVDGINIKLMKAGGLTEAMRMIHTAKACGLQIMFGCYSDSTLANTAMSHLAPLADYLDLDSHLNLTDDLFTGATLQKGCLIPNENPGIGIQKNQK